MVAVYVEKLRKRDSDSEIYGGVLNLEEMALKEGLAQLQFGSAPITMKGEPNKAGGGSGMATHAGAPGYWSSLAYLRVLSLPIFLLWFLLQMMRRHLIPQCWTLLLTADSVV